MTAPSELATTGLQSSSAISGWAAASAATRSMMSATAEPVEERERAQLAQHGSRLVGADRSQADLHVADQLCCGPPGADGDQRAEARIADHADDQLYAGGRHSLHEKSFRGHSGRPQ